MHTSQVRVETTGLRSELAANSVATGSPASTVLGSASVVRMMRTSASGGRLSACTKHRRSPALDHAARAPLADLPVSWQATPNRLAAASGHGAKAANCPPVASRAPRFIWIARPRGDVITVAPAARATWAVLG